MKITFENYESKQNVDKAKTVYSSRENFQLNSKTFVHQINFDLIVEVTGARFNPKQCQIGFQINDFDDDKNIFIKILKEKNVINSYIFFMKFNNLNEGNFFVGNLPEENVNFTLYVESLIDSLSVMAPRYMSEL